MRLAAIRQDPLARRDIGATTAPGRSAPVRHRQRSLRCGRLVGQGSTAGVSLKPPSPVGLVWLSPITCKDIAYVKIVPDSGDNLITRRHHAPGCPHHANAPTPEVDTAIADGARSERAVR